MMKEEQRDAVVHFVVGMCYSQFRKEYLFPLSPSKQDRLVKVYNETFALVWKYLNGEEGAFFGMTPSQREVAKLAVQIFNPAMVRVPLDPLPASQDKRSGTTAAEDVLSRREKQYRNTRCEHWDMVTAEEILEFVKLPIDTLRQMAKNGRVIRVENARGKEYFPTWQFEPPIWGCIQGVFTCLNTDDHWLVLDFMEVPFVELGGKNPRQAIGQLKTQEVMNLAQAKAVK